MAKPNYSFEKRQRELAKKKKKEEKARGKATSGGGGHDESQAPGDTSTSDVPAAPAADGAAPR